MANIMKCLNYGNLYIPRVSKYSKSSTVFAEKIWFFKEASFDPNTTIFANNVKLCAETCLISKQNIEPYILRQCQSSWQLLCKVKC